MTWLILGGTLVLKLAQSILSKESSDLIHDMGDNLRSSAWNYLLAALLSLPVVYAFGGFGVITGAAILYAAMAGISLAICTMCMLIAMQEGAIVLVNLAACAGILIPCISGIFLFDEPMSLAQFLGVALLLVSAKLLVGYSKNLTGKFTWKTFWLLLGAMLGNGVTMLSQKLVALKAPEVSVPVFVFLLFLIAGVLLVILSLLYGRSHTMQPLPKKLILWSALLAVVILGINVLGTMGAETISSVVLYGVSNGGGAVLAALAGAVLYREKLTKESIAGIIAGIAALCMIQLL